MYRFLTALQRGFHDWIGWKRLGIAASLLIIVIATSTLIRTLKGVDINVILLALRDISPTQIGACGALRRLRVLHADLLRPVRAAHDRQAACSLSHRRALELHELHDRPQCRRHGVHRRRDPLPHLFGMGPHRDRRRKDLLRLRPDLLARQPVRARHRHGLASRCRDTDEFAAGGGQPADRRRLHRRHRRVSGVAGGAATAGASSARTAGRSCCRRRS